MIQNNYTMHFGLRKRTVGMLAGGALAIMAGGALLPTGAMAQASLSSPRKDTVPITGQDGTTLAQEQRQPSGRPKRNESPYRHGNPFCNQEIRPINLQCGDPLEDAGELGGNHIVEEAQDRFGSLTTRFAGKITITHQEGRQETIELQPGESISSNDKGGVINQSETTGRVIFFDQDNKVIQTRQIPARPRPPLILRG